MQEVIDYIKKAPIEIQSKLHALRTLLLETIDGATETFAYQMPTYVYYRNLIHFAYHKNHIGIYPSPSGVAYALTLRPSLKTSKGTILFDNKEDLPMDLIKAIVLFRIAENDELYGMKQRMKTE